MTAASTLVVASWADTGTWSPAHFARNVALMLPARRVAVSSILLLSPNFKVHFRTWPRSRPCNTKLNLMASTNPASFSIFLMESTTAPFEIPRLVRMTATSFSITPKILRSRCQPTVSLYSSDDAQRNKQKKKNMYNLDAQELVGG
jgi:hypothetical protein